MFSQRYGILASIFIASGKQLLVISTSDSFGEARFDQLS